MAPKSGRARRGPALLAGIAGSALLGSGRGTVGVWLGDRAHRRGAALAADRAWAADAGGGGGADCGAAGGCCGPEWRRRAAEPAGARHCSLVSLGSALLGSGRGTVGVWLGDRAHRRGPAACAVRTRAPGPLIRAASSGRRAHRTTVAVW